MRHVTLEQAFNHHIAQRYLSRSGVVHAIAVAYHAFHLAVERDLDVDVATKAGLLHDMGHYMWYKNGKWDYEMYREYDIHAIKGANRAHKLLIRLGENPIIAKEIALAILFHTDSFIPNGDVVRTPIQEIIKLADEKDEESGGNHHYRTTSPDHALLSIARLDELVDNHLKQKSSG
jgi:uncharacterized protein